MLELILGISTAWGCDPLIAQAERQMQDSAMNILGSVAHFYEIAKPWAVGIAIIGVMICAFMLFFGQQSAIMKFFNIILSVALFHMIFAITGFLLFDLTGTATLGANNASSFSGTLRAAFVAAGC